MISTNKSFATEPVIDIEILKNQFPQYYSYIHSDELLPIKAIICSKLIVKKDASLEKIILAYDDKLILIKDINGSISKHCLRFDQIDYIVSEGIPGGYCLTIEYGEQSKEIIFYDTIGELEVGALLSDVRRSIAGKTKADCEISHDLFCTKQEPVKYLGAYLARSAVMDKNSVAGCITQKKLYNKVGLVNRRVLSQAHFSIICKREIIVFKEKHISRGKAKISGDLIHIPMTSIKNISVISVDKGMIMRYLFCSGRKLELFYDNDNTEQLIKIMAFVNGMISK